MATFTLTPPSYGKVVGRFIVAIGDGVDADVYPDGVVPTGTVTFTPSVTKVLIGNGNPSPFTFELQPITATLDSSGYLTFNNQTGVWLVATNDTNTNPSAFTYSVQYNISYGGGVIDKTKFDMSVPVSDPTDATTWSDLAKAAPVPTSTGAAIVKGDKGDTGAPGLTWRGAWTSGNTYAIGDAVSSGGSSYVATAAIPNSTNTPPFTGWSLLAAAGTGGTGSGYSPPVGGIPKTDLSAAVQTSLGKADSALQAMGAVDYSLLPAGVTLTVIKNGSVWPARPTPRTDLIVQWKGPDPSPAIGGTGMVDNVDGRLVTP